jgi:hypothetical protein
MSLSWANIWKARSAIYLLTPLALLPTTCATPYQPLGSRGGYSHYRISDDVFSVSFRGNAATREDAVGKYLLRRASEVTLEHGFRYFVILSEEDRTRAVNLGVSGMVRVGTSFDSPGTSVRIRCFHDRPPPSESPIDATEFLQFNFPEVLSSQIAASSLPGRD